MPTVSLSLSLLCFSESSWVPLVSVSSCCLSTLGSIVEFSSPVSTAATTGTACLIREATGLSACVFPSSDTSGDCVSGSDFSTISGLVSSITSSVSTASFSFSSVSWSGIPEPVSGSVTPDSSILVSGVSTIGASVPGFSISAASDSGISASVWPVADVLDLYSILLSPNAVS